MSWLSPASAAVSVSRFRRQLGHASVAIARAVSTPVMPVPKEPFGSVIRLWTAPDFRYCPLKTSRYAIAAPRNRSGGMVADLASKDQESQKSPSIRGQSLADSDAWGVVHFSGPSAGSVPYPHPAAAQYGPGTGNQARPAHPDQGG